MTTATQLALIPSTDDDERQALLDALRRNFSLLSELAVRYEVETRPERPRGHAPSSTGPGRSTTCWARR